MSARSRPLEPTVCEWAERSLAFARDDHGDSSRAQYAAHLETCSVCSEAVAGALHQEFGSGETESAAVARRALDVATRVSERESESLRSYVERLLAWRALRCVAAFPPLGLDAQRSLAKERRVGDALNTLLRSIANAHADTELRTELSRLEAWVADYSDSAVSYDRLRECDVLLPRPPRLPAVGDWSGRARVLSWAEMVLRDSDPLAI